MVIFRMAENTNTEPGPLTFPEGIDILKSDSTGKISVVNEVLNFYQRKLNVLNKAVVLNLAHNQFEQTELEQAKEILRKLWVWKNLTPSSPNEYIYKNLEAKRQRGSNTKPSLARDIINFFEVEDRNLDVTFLTLKCEVIPSKVHESEAMKDVYVLLHKSQEDYETVFHRLNDRDDNIISQGLTMEALKEEIKSVREEMKKGFLDLSSLLKKNEPINTHPVPPVEQAEPLPNIMISSDFENELVEVPMAADNISGEYVLQAAEEVVIVE